MGAQQPRKLSVQPVAGQDSFQSSPAYIQKYYRWTKSLGYSGGDVVIVALISMARIRRRKAFALESDL